MPRRKRYAAEGLTKNGEPQEIFFMAYSLADAVALAHEKGYEFKRMMPYKEMVQRDLRQQGGFKLDPGAVREAIEFYGLKLPVKIRYSSRLGSTRGNYRCGRTRSGPNFHNIMLKSYLSAEQASKTLWHELTHAMQAEREILAAGRDLLDPEAKQAWTVADVKGKGRSYLDKPIEVEAREAEELAEACPLAVRA